MDKSVKIYEKVISQPGSEDTEFKIDSYNLGLALASLGKFEKKAWEFIEYRFDIGISKYYVKNLIDFQSGTVKMEGLLLFGKIKVLEMYFFMLQ